MKITKIQSKLISLFEGKKAILTSYVLGVMTLCALPPLFLLPLAVIGISLHLWSLDVCANKKEALKLGWWFGFGFFTSGIYWIGIALMVDAASFAWLIPFAVFGLSGILACYFAIISCLTFALPLKGVARIVMFSLIWTCVELLREVLFTGFPWNLIGYVWGFSENMIQIAHVVGVWGLGFLTVFVCSIPYLFISKHCERSTKWKAVVAGFLGILIILGVWVYGNMRLESHQTSYVDDVKIRIVQPNIEQDLKWQEGEREQIVQRVFSMTRAPGFDEITHVVWPESALPYFIYESSPLLESIQNMVPKNGAVITGSTRVAFEYVGIISEIWNSLHIIDDQGRIVDYYDKTHLVPFGEYVPLRGFIPFIQKITHGAVDFSWGLGKKTLHAPSLPAFSPMICYDAIFSGDVVNRDHFPEFMLQVTNDGWYGKSSAAFQHFHMARMRSVEEGIPLVRAANTGISAIVDAYGRIIKRTKMDEQTVLDGRLPQPSEVRTFFSQNSIILKIFVLAITSFLYLLTVFLIRKPH